METKHPHLTHTWEADLLAAQILRSWVRETHAALPAWTPETVSTAYTQLLRGCEAVIAATQAAAKEHDRG